MGTSKNKHLGATKVFRERGQTASRARLGLLEKHKDYVHRARDYRSKQDRLKKLREKAAFRNKDEFYHGMIRAKTKNGVETGDRGNVALGVDTVKMLKTQDVGYVKVQIARDQKKIEKIRKEIETLLPPDNSFESEWTPLSELAEIEKLAEMGIVVNPSSTGTGKGKVDKHILFAENDQDLLSIGAGPSTVKPSQIETEVEDLGWEEEKSRLKKKNAAVSTDVEGKVDDEEEEKQSRQYRLSLYSSLSAHLVRLKELRQIESKLGSTIGLYGKGSATKARKAGWVQDESMPEDRNGERKRYEKTLFKWKLERKK